MAESKENTAKPEEDIHPVQEFLNEFEELVKKHKVEKYIAVFNVGDENKPLVVHRPNDLNEITRVLKMTHAQFFNRVMQSIGETN